MSTCILVFELSTVSVHPVNAGMPQWGCPSPAYTRTREAATC